MPDFKSATERNAQLAKYQPMVRRMAYHLLSRLPPSVEMAKVGMRISARSMMGCSMRRACQP